MLVIGNSKVHFADKVIEVKKQALTFSNPLIPNKWEDTTNIGSGVLCIFDDEFSISTAIFINILCFSRAVLMSLN